MKLIVITSPDFLVGEATAISSLFDAGLEILHLRKPTSTIDELRCLLKQIPECYMDRIVVHEHFSLVDEFHLKGIHLNRRNSSLPNDYDSQVSCSCHSLEEVAKKKNSVDYLFLSPIFDSISKEGYNSSFGKDELKMASENYIIDEKVIALGGIDPQNIPEIKELGFGGIAVLGYIWNSSVEADVNIVVDNYLKLRNNM